MTIFLIILSLLAILVSAFLRAKFFEKILSVIHLISLFLFISAIILLVKNLRFAGQYTNTLIAVIYLTSTIMLLVITPTKAVKAYCALIILPLLLIMISFTIFDPPLKRDKINNHYNLEVHKGNTRGTMNSFYLVKHKGLFDKYYPLSSSYEFPSNIRRLEILNFQEKDRIVCKFYGYHRNEFFVDTLYLLCLRWYVIKSSNLSQKPLLVLLTNNRSTSYFGFRINNAIENVGQ